MRKIIMTLALSCLVLFAQTTSPAAEPLSVDTTSFEVSERILDVPDPLAEMVEETFTISPDCSRVVYAVKNKNGKIFVIADGEKMGKEYGSIGAPFFSRDGRRVAFLAVRDGRRMAVVDGVEGKQYDDASLPTLAFSPDGTRFAFAGKTGGTYRLVVDGIEEKTGYEFIDTPVFSPDGRRVAYKARSGDEQNGRNLVVVDGQVGELYNRTGQPVWSSDSRRVAYWGSSSWTYVVCDGVKGNKCFQARSLTFLPGSGKLAYLADGYKTIRLVVDGAEGPEYDESQLPGLAVSPDGSRIAYTARRGKTFYMVVDGKEEGPYDEMGYPRISPDSKKVAYAAKKDGKYFIVVNGKPERPYDGMSYGNMFFAPAGNRLVYFALKGKKIVAVVDGKEGAPYDNAGRPAFSPDGKRVAYVADSGKKEFIAADGRESPRVDQIGSDTLVFGPDGTHWAAMALLDDHNCLLVDGRVAVRLADVTMFEKVLSKPVFDSPNELHFICTYLNVLSLTRVKIK
jgi:Tol biopolymer transport system component